MATVHKLQYTESAEPWGGFLPADLLELPPPREWLVDAMVPRRTVVMLSGAPKRGKSLLLQQMLTACALGKPWIGVPTERCRAVGLFMEDDKDELARREFNIVQAYGAELYDLGEALELNPRETLPTRLFNYRGCDPVPTPLWHRLWEVVELGHFELIGLDTASLVFGGAAIINIEKVTNSLRELHKMAAKFDASVVITAHTNKADPTGFSGPNAWLGTVRAGMNLNIAFDNHTHEPIRNERILTDLGGNYGTWEPIRLRWKEGVWEPIPGDCKITPRPRTSEDHNEFRGRVSKFLYRAVRRGIVVPIDETDKHSLPAMIRKHERVAYNDLNAAIEYLLDHGAATLVKVRGKCVIRPRDLRYEEEEPWL